MRRKAWLLALGSCFWRVSHGASVKVITQQAVVRKDNASLLLRGHVPTVNHAGACPRG